MMKSKYPNGIFTVAQEQALENMLSANKLYCEQIVIKREKAAQEEKEQKARKAEEKRRQEAERQAQEHLQRIQISRRQLRVAYRNAVFLEWERKMDFDTNRKVKKRSEKK